MSNSNGIISAPVSMKDVQTVLGDSSTSLASLCLSTKVNMWAKYKPIPSNDKFLDIKTGYRGKGYNCGISYSTANSVSGIRALYSQTDNGYSYEKPTVYRLADFNGYCHSVKAPVTGYSFADECVTTQFSCTCTLGALNTDYGLTFEDILKQTDDEEYYFGVALYKGTLTTPTFFKTATKSFFLTVNFHGDALNVGTYTVVPFLSSVKYESLNETAKAGTYIALPNVTLKTVTLINQTSELLKKISLKQNTNGTCTITNNDSESHVITLQLRFTTSSESSYILSGEAELISSETLAAGGSTSADYSLDMQSGKSYALWLYVDGTLLKKNTVIKDASTDPAS